MEQKELNNLSAEELDAMADALLAADDAKQAETKAAPAADEPAEDKPVAEKPESEKTTEEKLNELVEKGKKAGKLSSKDLMVLEDMNLSSEETEKFYDQLESLNIDVLSDDALPPVDEDALPELEELQEIEEVTEEEMNETEAMADTFSTDDPEYLAQSFQRIIFALDWHQHRICRYQRIDRQKTQRRRAVDDNKIILIADCLQITV